jgi:hypothetical protein
MEDGRYAEKLVAFMRSMLRLRENSGVALAYIANSSSKELVSELKKEIVIFARGDIGENQLNAIACLGLIPQDEDSQKTMAMLLSHWDEEARRAAAEIILKNRTETGVSAAKKRVNSETDPQIKELLKKITR